MVSTHTLLKAFVLFGLSHALQTTLQTPSCDLPPSCREAVIRPQRLIPDLPEDCNSANIGPGTDCTFYMPNRDAQRRYRTSLLSFPANWSKKTVHHKSHPLILSFHGRTQNSQKQQTLTGLSDNTIGAIVAYPQGRQDQWQGDPRANPDIDDIGFITSLISLLEQEPWGVDSTRIYATGKSNGGGFLDLLACDPTLSQTIAAFAAASGAFYVNGTGDPGLVLPTCSPSNAKRPVPFMEFHGTGDCMIQYDGGSNHAGEGETRRVFDVISYWGGQQPQCNKDYTMTTESCGSQGDIERYSWTCNGVADTVVHYKIPGLAHDWPSVCGNYDCQNPGVPDRSCPTSCCTTCIDATPIILSWLQKFSIPRTSSSLNHHASSEEEL